jgi:transmembrane 9 superfamily protein 2/4
MGRLVGLLLCLGATLTTAFYLPGVMPHDYKEGEKVKVRVNRLDSVRTQLPFDYYNLPFCQPEELRQQPEKMGEILRGDRIETSMYNVKTLTESSCNILCHGQYNADEMKQFADKIKDEYRAHWVVDNLPAAYRLNLYTTDPDAPPEQQYSYERGFLIGFVGGDLTYLSHQAQRNAQAGVPYINNHLRLVFKYHNHENPETHEITGVRIVGFEVYPASVKHTYPGSKFNPERNSPLTSCTPLNPIWKPHNLYPEQMMLSNVEPQPVDNPGEIIWTYDVKWESSDIRWASRWDLYMYMGEDQVHWFSIVNSLLVVIFLSGMVAMIMIRALNNDILTYNDVDQEEMREETGWKLVHGDVFRPPRYINLLGSLVGSGCQILLCAFVILFFAVLGFLSPSNRGALMTCMLFSLAFLGVSAGFASAYVYKSLQGDQWRQNTILTATLFPSMIGGIFLFLNFFVWHEGSTIAIPFLQLFELFLLYIFVYVPLVFLGAFTGYKQEPFTMPCRVQPIPRLIPAQPWHLSPLVSIFLGGIVPFGAIFIELFFILTSIWMHKFYYLFGFLLLVFIILIFTCAEISIVMCYFHLCTEDYHWWWRAFLTSGSSAIWMYLYSAYYFSAELQIEAFVPTLLYFGYNFITCLGFFVMTGTVGVVSCFLFIIKIYSSIKVD